MTIDTRACPAKPKGFGTWMFRRGGTEVSYSGWFGDAPAYLAANYGAGHWYVAA